MHSKPAAGCCYWQEQLSTGCAHAAAVVCLQRKRLADEKRAAEEAELAARLAYEARAEFEKEEAERKAAKEALKAFLLK
jgi:hypothetical protein